MVAGYSDGTMRVFSISRTEMELKMHPHATALTAIAYSTDGEVPCCNRVEMLLWGAVKSPTRRVLFPFLLWLQEK